ncbi:MAG: hypothetical protein LCH35_11495 [Bacteroidetes bacterium]|uniref:hypothetical protein n=1 Tax=Flavobacterium sp. TaxID=239 RepID=UPI002FDA9EE4|nr:hypothetical protein [Bacteroidota bacterium]
MSLVDISNWPSGNQRFVPIGKRIKKVVLHPTSFDLYYFKEPKEKYPWEFWNEIIAYEVGKKLGFNVLKYEPAILDGIGGCLSKSMTEDFTQELIHGQQVLLRIYPEFETKKGTDHTFQLVESFFKSMNEEEHKLIINDFIEMLVFDAIIGNRDRHQQNWAIIREIKVQIRTGKYFSLKKQTNLPIITRTVRFSPLFDNGNCLAYNIIEENLHNFIDDENKLDKYLFGEKAVSHLKWYGAAMPHIELLNHISKIYPEVVLKSIIRVESLFNENIINDIVLNIDNGTIFADEIYSLSPKRKELISKLITTRTKRLIQAFL